METSQSKTVKPLIVSSLRRVWGCLASFFNLRILIFVQSLFNSKPEPSSNVPSQTVSLDCTNATDESTPIAKPVDALSDLIRRDRDLQDHLKALGLESVEQYIRWCAENGFSQKVCKNWKLRCKERFRDKEDSIESRLKLRKLERRRPAEVIEKIFAGEIITDELTTPWLIRVLESAQSFALTEHREAFRMLMMHACKSKSGMLSLREAHPKADVETNSFVDGLATLARAKSSWIREVKDWKPRSKRPHKQFGSLARHLVAKYAVPEFLDCVWFINEPEESKEQVDWFVKLGNGVSVREIGLPIRLTKSMVKHFIAAPYGDTVIEAIRRAQVISLGGNKRLVESLIDTRLATSTLNNEFWITVMRWFVRNPPPSCRTVGPLIEFFRNEKFPNGDELAQPTDYELKGKSLGSVMCEMGRWHVALRTTAKIAEQTWAPHPKLNGFEFSETNLVSGQKFTWTIKQLLSVEELRQEGRALKHCVLSYAPTCAKNETTIWSLKLSRDEGKSRRALTIEVAPVSLRIVQIRGKHNRAARPNETAVIARWASEQQSEQLKGS